MENISLVTKISFIGTILFGILWYVTSKDSVYETIEMEAVSTKKVFLYLAIVCFGFWLASIFFW
ncbi:MAG: hypothetical protein HQK77_20255 [Desulfobacterales bacterium]|nr:hypothetical protein [Desulfobacterales bacterium]